MYCPHCGSRLSDNARFCDHCGERQDTFDAGRCTAPTQNVHTQPPAYPARENWPPIPPGRPAQRRRKTIAILTIVLGLSLLVIFLINSDFFKSDEQLINERIDAFLDAYNSGNMTEVMECLDSKTRNTFQGMMGMGNALISGTTGFGFGISDMFGVAVGTVSGGDILKLSDRMVTIESDTTATVIATLSYKDRYSSLEDRAVITMVKEDGKWFIQNIEDK